jgi:hypothetical protein
MRCILSVNKIIVLGTLVGTGYPGTLRCTAKELHLFVNDQILLIIIKSDFSFCRVLRVTTNICTGYAGKGFYLVPGTHTGTSTCFQENTRHHHRLHTKSSYNFVQGPCDSDLYAYAYAYCELVTGYLPSVINAISNAVWFTCHTWLHGYPVQTSYAKAGFPEYKCLYSLRMDICILFYYCSHVGNSCSPGQGKFRFWGIGVPSGMSHKCSTFHMHRYLDSCSHGHKFCRGETVPGTCY